MREIGQLDGVRSAYMCWGRPDVIAFIEVPTHTDLSRLVVWRIHRIGGVEATDTRFVRLPKAKAEATQ